MGQYQHQDWGNKRQKIMSLSSCSSLSSSSSLSRFSSLSGTPPSPLSKRKKPKKIGLSLDIVRLISEFLEWEHLQLTRENYKVSPVSILHYWLILGMVVMNVLSSCVEV